MRFDRGGAGLKRDFVFVLFSQEDDEFGSFNDLTDWEKYALQEYEILVNEEGANQDA